MPPPRSAPLRPACCSRQATTPTLSSAAERRPRWPLNASRQPAGASPLRRDGHDGAGRDVADSRLLLDVAAGDDVAGVDPAAGQHAECLAAAVEGRRAVAEIR